MLDNKIILAEAKKLLDILSAQGYIWGKLEIDYDGRTRRTKIQIHQFEKQGEIAVRKTAVIVEQ